MAKKKNPVKEILLWIIENLLWDYGKPIIAVLVTYLGSYFDVLGIAEMYEWYIAYPLYFFLVYGAVQFFVDIYNAIWGDKLLQLTKARTAGVELRNRGVRISDEKVAKEWNDEYIEWDISTIKKIGRISESKAEYFKVINRYELTSRNIATLVSTHNNKINVLEEKLARLEKLIEELDKSD